MKFAWKIGNWLNRKKNQFSDFSDSYFSSYGRFSAIFCDVITPIFDDNSKNINLRIFSLFFPYYTAHSPSSIKGWSKVRGGVCTSLIGKNPFFWRVPTIFALCTHFSFKENIVLGWNQSSNFLPQKVVTDMRYFLLLSETVLNIFCFGLIPAVSLRSVHKHNLYNGVKFVCSNNLELICN